MEDYKIYVESDIAKKAVAKGFSENLCELVDETMRNGVSISIPKDCFTPDNYFIRICPNVSEIKNWLLKEKGIFIKEDVDNFDGIVCYIIGITRIDSGICVNEIHGSDYEQTILEVIDKALDLI